MEIKKIILSSFLLCFCLAQGNGQVRKQTVYLAGDSTCATNNNTENTSYRGWGQIEPFFFSPRTVKIINRARGGASTRTYRSLGLWDKILEDVLPGDIVTIQFGHNDENTDARGTTPEEYRQNLSTFVDELLAKGAEPVLFTPILRRRYDGEKAMRGGGGNWNHLKYSPKVFEVAAEKNIPLIDGEKISEDWLNTMDPSEAKNFYVWFKPGDYPGFSKGKSDDTHLNQKGAYEIAKRFAKALCEVKPQLAPSYVDASYRDVEDEIGPIKIYFQQPEMPRTPTVTAKKGVESYCYSPEIAVSDKYKVEVNGVPVTVLKTDEPDLAIFGAEKEVSVKITLLQGSMDSLYVRPLAKKYRYSFKKNVINLKLKAGDRVSVEPDRSQEKPLFIFVNEPSAGKSVQAAKDPNTIYFCGGRTYKMDRLKIKGGQRVYIEGGAVVEAYIDHRDTTSNITIEGCGVFDSRSFARPNAHNAIKIADVDSLKVRDITVLNADFWTTYFIRCDHSSFYNMHVVATASHNAQGHENDGFNIVGCQHVDIKGCFSYAHDDAYCIKSSPGKIFREVCDVHYEDCVGWNITSGNTFEIGYTVRSDVYDIWYKNLYCIHSGGKPAKFRRAGISIHNGGGGHVHDIHYENVYVEDPLEHIFSFNTFKTPYKTYEWFPGTITDVTVKNLRSWKPAPDGNQLKGFDQDHLTERVTIEDFFVGDRKITDLKDADIRDFSFVNDIRLK